MVGALHPALQEELELPVAFVFELRLDALCRRQVAVASPPSRYPEVGRDLAFILDEKIEVGEIEREVRAAAGPMLRGLRVLDVYRGQPVPGGAKSIALGLTWQAPSRTLGDAEIDQIIESIIKVLEHKFNASLRN